ncbi:AAA family ATPase [Embleya sp. AB8]|uniref:AAA family ATPase n=1 Tax=Embleya sp. AB8 TaxID=3156304 RepID=UPI003C7789F3
MLHGRNDELAAITALLQRTRAGDGGAIVLRGAAGTGKTTLLAEAAWAAKGMTVLRTAGPCGAGALPYTALRQLLVTLHPRIGRLPHTRAQALRTALGLAPGAADRGVVAAAACSLVLIAAREQPVLLLVDDAHWLDAASAAVITYIAGRAEGLPLAVLRTTRERGGAGAAMPKAEPGDPSGVGSSTRGWNAAVGGLGTGGAAGAEVRAGAEARAGARAEVGSGERGVSVGVLGTSEECVGGGADTGEPTTGDASAAAGIVPDVTGRAASVGPLGADGVADARRTTPDDTSNAAGGGPDATERHTSVGALGTSGAADGVEADAGQAAPGDAWAAAGIVPDATERDALVLTLGTPGETVGVGADAGRARPDDTSTTAGGAPTATERTGSVGALRAVGGPPRVLAEVAGVGRSVASVGGSGSAGVAESGAGSRGGRLEAAPNDGMFRTGAANRATSPGSADVRHAAAHDATHGATDGTSTPRDQGAGGGAGRVAAEAARPAAPEASSVHADGDGAATRPPHRQDRPAERDFRAAAEAVRGVVTGEVGTDEAAAAAEARRARAEGGFFDAPGPSGSVAEGHPDGGFDGNDATGHGGSGPEAARHADSYARTAGTDVFWGAETRAGTWDPRTTGARAGAADQGGGASDARATGASPRTGRGSGSSDTRTTDTGIGAGAGAEAGAGIGARAEAGRGSGASDARTARANARFARSVGASDARTADARARAGQGAGASDARTADARARFAQGAGASDMRTADAAAGVRAAAGPGPRLVDGRSGGRDWADADDAAAGRDRATGARPDRVGRDVAAGDGPFAGLPEDARRLVALAALEPAADLDQLAVAGRRVGIGRGARLAVLRAGLVDAAEHRVRFRSASVREEVRRSLSAAERRSLHGALAYAASGALAYRRPWHLAALATGPDAELAAALEAGAGRTRRELGAGAAAATWEQAARLTADHPTARRRYVAAAYAAWEAGFPVRARTLLDTADATDVEGGADEGSSAHSSGTAIRLRAALRHAEGHRSEAGALLLDAAHGRAALLLAATGAAWEAGDRARTTQARAALSALPLASDDPLRTVVAALGADGVSPAMVAPATRARLYGLGIALWEVTPLAVHAAATDQAAYEVLLDEAAVLRTHGARGALAAALMPLAVAGALSGRAVEAETHAAEGLRLARATGQGTLAAWFLAALSMAATTQGRIAEARDGAWQALRLTGTKGLTPVGAYALYALAVVERAEGRTEAACELLATALAAPAGALMEVRIRAELATAGPNRTGLAALPPRPTHAQLPGLTLTGRIPRTPQLAAGGA